MLEEGLLKQTTNKNEIAYDAAGDTKVNNNLRNTWQNEETVSNIVKIFTSKQCKIQKHIVNNLSQTDKNFLYTVKHH